LAEGKFQSSRCTNCGSTDFIKDYEHGELVCEKCGYVAEEHIVDHSAEWRAFDEEEREKRDRAGAPLSLMIHDGGLSTQVGRAPPSMDQEHVDRMARWQDRVRVSNSSDRNLSHALNVIMKVGDSLNLPRTIL